MILSGTGNGRGPGSSPDSIGAGDTLTGCVSTPSSEALDQVSDLRYAKTLPKRIGSVITNNDNASSNGTRVTLNKFSTHFVEQNSDRIMILFIFHYFILQENYTFLNNNNYSNKAIPNSSASVLNGNLGSSNRGSNRIVEDLYAKVGFEYHLFSTKGPKEILLKLK